MAEGIYDLHQCLKEHNKRIVDRLYDWNILGPKTLLGHCIYINEHEMESDQRDRYNGRTQSGIQYGKCLRMSSDNGTGT